MCGKVGLLLLSSGGKFRVIVGFAVPLLMLILTVDIDCGIKSLCALDRAGYPPPRFFDPDIADRELLLSQIL